MTDHPHGYSVMLGLVAGLPLVASILAPVVFVLLAPPPPQQPVPRCECWCEPVEVRP